MEYSPSLGIQMEGIVKYVDRGDPATPDFDVESGLVMDNNWHELDLSGIVSEAGAGNLVLLYVHIVHEDDLGVSLSLREKGNVNEQNIGCITAQVSGTAMRGNMIAQMDEDRKVEYKGHTDLLLIEMTVRGWLEE